MRNDRAVSPIIAVLLMTAVAILIAATVSVFVLDISETVDQSGPTAAFEQQLLDDGSSDERLEVTLTQGDHLRADQVMIVATEPVDLGGANADPNGGYATVGEKLTEGADQTGVGEYWTSGESILIGGVGDLSEVTVHVVWNPTEVRKDGQGGKAPSDIIGESSVILWTHTVN
jgi:flagellin-like protein